MSYIPRFVEQTDEISDLGTRALCAAICAQSVKDFFRVMEAMDGYISSSPPNTDVLELDTFFKSAWGRKLFGLFGLNTEAALRSLKETYENGTYKNKLKFDHAKKWRQDDEGV